MRTSGPIDIEADLEELRQLACLVAGEPDLQLVEGSAGSGWSYSHGKRRISMDGHRLRVETRDFNRGLVLHESAHAAITRLHEIVRGDYFRRRDVFSLINAMEDCRIETWLAERFPGSRRWIREYNDILIRTVLPGPGPDSDGKPTLGLFVAGLMACWWRGRENVVLPDALKPLVEEAWPAVEAICKALPESGTSPLESNARYRSDPVSGLYLAADVQGPPDAWEMEIRVSQAAMWRAFSEGILPIARRLAPPSGSGRMSQEQQKLFERFLQEHHLGPGGQAGGGFSPPMGSRGWARGAGSGMSLPMLQRGAASDGQDARWDPDPEAYARAVRSQESAIERLGTTVLRLLQPQTQRRWSGPHRAGTRLNLAGARRAEGDPRRFDEVWDRQSLPSRPDPLVVLLLDRSGSMEGPKMAATFEAVVLLVEVCHRLEIALGIYTFSHDCERLLDWQESLDPAVCGRIGGLPRAANGGTRLERSLVQVHGEMAASGFTDPFLVVLSDGDLDDDENPRGVVRAMEADGIRVMGLGLGPGTEALGGHIANSRTNLEPSKVPSAFAELLVRAVRGNQPSK